jgi:hypothetical protein
MEMYESAVTIPGSKKPAFWYNKKEILWIKW